MVALPSRVTGFSLMSRRQMITFMYGRQCRRNSSQCGAIFRGSLALDAHDDFFFFIFLSAIRTSNHY